MKFSKLRQLFLVSSIGLVLATTLIACQIITIDYVFVASSSGIDTFAVDSESGALRTAVAPVTSGVNGPVAMAVSPDFANLYVANAGNNSVVHYAIALNGTLTSKDTITLPGAPAALTVNAADSYLYVVYGTTSATLAAYPLSSGTIGTSAASVTPLIVPSATSDVIIPTGINVLANSGAVYATAYDQSVYNPGGTVKPGDTTNPGWVFGFTVGTGGALAPSLGSPYLAGVKPSGIVSDPTNRFVYITDVASNQLIGYGITGNSTLNYLIDGPFRTGNEPTAITIDPRGKFLYVANLLDNSVSAYAISLQTGTPSAAVNVTGSSTNSTDTEPVAIAVDPALGRFVFTANFLGNSVSGFRLDPTAGTLQPTQSTPYSAGQKPTTLLAVPHGNHSIQSITP